MSFDPRPYHAAAWAALGIATLVFVAVFVWPARQGESVRRRDPRSRVGMACQALAFGLLFGFYREPLTSFAPLGTPAAVLLDALAVLLAAGGLALVVGAKRALGRNWALDAQIREGHRLVRAGPYAWVRNPIYTGMFGLLLAVGLVVSRWWVLPFAAFIYAVGTAVRIRSEERLLREAFGDEFESYRRGVPSVIPRPPRRSA